MTISTTKPLPGQTNATIDEPGGSNFISNATLASLATAAITPETSGDAFDLSVGGLTVTLEGYQSQDGTGTLSLSPKGKLEGTVASIIWNWNGNLSEADKWLFTDVTANRLWRFFDAAASTNNGSLPSHFVGFMFSGNNVIDDQYDRAGSLYGSNGNDTLTGDHLGGGGGNDVLIPIDYSNFIVNGSTGYDTLKLTSESNVVITSSEIFDIEEIDVSINTTLTNSSLTMGAGTLGPGGKLTIKVAGPASGEPNSDTFHLDVSALAGARLTITGGAENDVFNLGGVFKTVDKVDGGGGQDVVSLDGDYSAGLKFTATTMVNVQTITLAGTTSKDSGIHSYNLTPADPTVAAGATLEVDGSALASGDTLVFDGAKEKDGSFNLIGGGGNDTLVGGAMSDTIDGGVGVNQITGGGGGDKLIAESASIDTFIYNKAADSTNTGFDTISGFSATTDKIELWAAVSAIAAPVTTGSLSMASFDADLKAALGAARLPKGDAVLFTPDGGGLKGETFLVVDTGAAAGYQAGKDLVIQLVGASHLDQLSLSDFLMTPTVTK